ncbi:phosphoethanolamine transferase [Chitinilyticum litopenaei]|uniref:phosphoethanolamine transferase n=1 Tax=Chitinilyticum litopenaei TaxID=1121276 RepID=UPI000420DE09|nr:phosphoethanolamine--lipid A transferase [Chitinilyticum litopenaei]
MHAVFKRWRLPAWALALLLSAWTLALGNLTFWHSAARILDAGRQPALLLALAGLLLVVFLLGCNLLLWPRIGKYLAGLWLLALALCAYFVDTYHVYLNADMAHNALQTDYREAGELFSLRLLGYLLLLWGLPVLLLLRTELRFPPTLPGLLRQKTLLSVLALAVAVLLVLPFYSGFASLVRNNKMLRYQINPLNAVYATFRLAAGERHVAPQDAQPYGRDARLAGWMARPARKPMLMVMVLGETARAESFALNGYARPTNPELAQLPVVSLTQVSACGTETAVSVPCLFSGYTREEFSLARAQARENLLDIARHAGYRVLWLDNNSGSKGVAARVGEMRLPDGGAAPDCRADECYDGALLGRLQQALQGPAQDTLVVLHQKGNHGPAYYLRYPPAFEAFSPVCRSNQLQDCPRGQIVNAYDNAIRYTDHVLAGAVRLSAAHAEYQSALLYVSDHGESTGEHGLYLHATPYLIAPQQQTRVPWIMWFSPDYLAASGLSRECVAAHRTAPYSHDNVFPTLLGALGIATSARRAELDLLAPCRST